MSAQGNSRSEEAGCEADVTAFEWKRLPVLQIHSDQM